MKRETYELHVKKALELYEKAHIVLTDDEKSRIEVADLGLDIVDKIVLLMQYHFLDFHLHHCS